MAQKGRHYWPPPSHRRVIGNMDHPGEAFATTESTLASAAICRRDYYIPSAKQVDADRLMQLLRRDPFPYPIIYQPPPNSRGGEGKKFVGSDEEYQALIETNRKLMEEEIANERRNRER